MTFRITPLKWTALIVGLLFAVSVFAKPDRSLGQEWTEHRGPTNAESRVARMTEYLGLTDEQSAQLLVVLQEVDAERRIIHEQVMQQIEPDVCALQISTEEQIAVILTEEQLLALQEAKEDRSGRREGRGGRGMGELDCSIYQ